MKKHIDDIQSHAIQSFMTQALGENPVQNFLSKKKETETW